MEHDWWDRIEALRVKPEETECVAVIDRLLELLNRSQRGVVDICRLATSGADMEAVLEAGARIVHESSLYP
jgi:hypothetical protein